MPRRSTTGRVRTPPLEEFLKQAFCIRVRKTWVLNDIAPLGDLWREMSLEPNVSGFQTRPSRERAVEVDLTPFAVMRRLEKFADSREEDVDECLDPTIAISVPRPIV